MDRGDPLSRFDIALVRAENPGPLTLSGTNTWIIGRQPCWVVDPGPALEAHLGAIEAEVARRGGAGGIALTHDHGDHADGLEALGERLGDPPVGAARHGGATLSHGANVGPLRAHRVPGHAPDHLAFVAGPVCFSGDAVLGEGSVFIAPDPGALAGYIAALRGLRELPLELICPGHGPLVLDPQGKLDGYVAHRLEREERLLAALAAGRRTVEELLDFAWSDVPAALRPVAAITLAAHLDKLADEGRLSEGVERPRF